MLCLRLKVSTAHTCPQVVHIFLVLQLVLAGWPFGKPLTRFRSYSCPSMKTRELLLSLWHFRQQNLDNSLVSNQEFIKDEEMFTFVFELAFCSVFSSTF